MTERPYLRVRLFDPCDREISFKYYGPEKKTQRRKKVVAVPSMTLLDMVKSKVCSLGRLAVKYI